MIAGNQEINEREFINTIKTDANTENQQSQDH